MTSSTAAPAPSILGGPSLPQERRLVTAIPGPISEELMARKHAAVASGVGTTMPVFAAGAGGGVLVDVDGNSLIDLGSGIAVTGVGNSNPRVVEAVTRQLQEFTHTCFTITPTTPTSRSPRRSTASPPATTPSGPRCSTQAPKRSRTR